MVADTVKNGGGGVGCKQRNREEEKMKDTGAQRFVCRCTIAKKEKKTQEIIFVVGVCAHSALATLCLILVVSFLQSALGE
jgi:hypothetical protein